MVIKRLYCCFWQHSLFNQVLGNFLFVDPTFVFLLCMCTYSETTEKWREPYNSGLLHCTLNIFIVIYKKYFLEMFSKTYRISELVMSSIKTLHTAKTKMTNIPIVMLFKVSFSFHHHIHLSRFSNILERPSQSSDSNLTEYQ